MKTTAIAFCFLCGWLFADHAHAKDITVTLNDGEQKALAQVLDLAVKQGGLQAAGAVSYFANKFSAQPDPVAAPAKADEKKPVEGTVPAEKK